MLSHNRKKGCAKAFLFTASTAPRRTFVRLSERFSCLRVFYIVFYFLHLLQNAFSHVILE